MIEIVIGLAGVIGSIAMSIGMTEYSLRRSEEMAEKQLARSEALSTEQYQLSMIDQKKLIADQEARANATNRRLAEQSYQDQLAYESESIRRYEMGKFGSNTSRGF